LAGGDAVRIPVVVRIAALTLGTTAFYTYVGQLVPQKEVHPPAEVALSKEMGPDEMRKVGRELMEGKGLCFTCHTVGKKGALRFPDLEGVGARAGERVPGQTDVEYLAQSLYDPDSFIVPGFNPGMPVINKPPIGLTDDEILAVIAYLQSLGGTTTVTMETELPWQAAHAPGGGGGAP
jgi:mono/diheme cytochrome c family protein